ncbi:hypothetical protein QE364_003893 [Nocardioides zeae]|uniref:Uncharacterized protein n=1 Tax=Nocardioides zeae TaxID=1457234 RepID=A0ACC6IN31_9ACTN|nr:hypothetical protein [Nocardioides zeae]MDR6212162.1 hypothetical protein [Nocardioides zeae]
MSIYADLREVQAKRDALAVVIARCAVQNLGPPLDVVVEDFLLYDEQVTALEAVIAAERAAEGDSE